MVLRLMWEFVLLISFIIGLLSNLRIQINEYGISELNDDVIPSFCANEASFVDWRTIKVPVYNQAACNCCWAITATDSLSYSVYIDLNEHKPFFEPFTFSFQELIDCSKGGGSEGCIRGNFRDASSYMQSNGITFEEDYPFTGASGTCERHARSGYRPYTFEEIPKSFEAIKRCVMKGPLLASIYVDGKNGKFAKYSDKEEYIQYECPKDGNTNEYVRTNHYIQVVGYGKIGKIEYLVIKNSHGTKWGHEGYGKIIINGKNKNPLCIKNEKSVRMFAQMF